MSRNGSVCRIKCDTHILIVRRNQVRDYLDVAALSDRYGIPHAGQVLARIDLYYTDRIRLAAASGTDEPAEPV